MSKQKKNAKPLNYFFCFYSIDIVDSTGLKLLHGQKKWMENIQDLNAKLQDLEIPLWKFLGDEWIFCQKIHSMRQFMKHYDNFQKIIEVTNDFDQSVRGRIWIIEEDEKVLAEIGNRKNRSSNADDDSMYYTYDSNDEIQDWVSFYLDIGFRFGKHCNAYDIAVSVEVAFLLASIVKLDRKFRLELHLDHEYHKKLDKHPKYGQYSDRLKEIYDFCWGFEAQKRFMYAKESKMKGFPKSYVNIILANKGLREEYQEDMLHYEEADFEKIYTYTSRFMRESFGQKRLDLYRKLSTRYPPL